MGKPLAATSHEWLSPETPLCELSVSVAELAAKVGIALHSWEEDGLGAFTGFACHLPSGPFALVQESEHAVKSLGAQGPAVLVEASELALHGVAALVTEVLASFGLQATHVTWRRAVPPASGSQHNGA